MKYIIVIVALIFFGYLKNAVAQNNDDEYIILTNTPQNVLTLDKALSHETARARTNQRHLDYNVYFDKDMIIYTTVGVFTNVGCILTIERV